ncbi:MAG TPA: hypothetical protein VFT98_05485 [Myxococcota bacterium]|nr:hypothetical protein [Myxococcota bacterium]
MSDATYFEVRCERCQSSFAPGTKQCVHCGAPLGRRLLGFDTRSGARAGGPTELDPQPGAPDASPSLGRIVQVAMIALAIVAAIARACFDRG